MRGKTHIPVGVATAALICQVTGIEMDLLFLGAAAIGSLIPDVDHAKSSLNQNLILYKNDIIRDASYFLYTALAILAYIRFQREWILYLIPVLFIFALAEHRGITHSLFFTVVVSGAAYRLETILLDSQYIWMGVAIGYIMHIAADCFTSHGVTLLWPYKKRCKFCITISTNHSVVERFISAVSGAYSMIVIGRMFLQQFKYF